MYYMNIICVLYLCYIYIIFILYLYPLSTLSELVNLANGAPSESRACPPHKTSFPPWQRYTLASRTP